MTGKISASLVTSAIKSISALVKINSVASETKYVSTSERPQTIG